MASELNVSKDNFFNMISVNIATLKLIIKDKLHTNKPLNILGPTGIGKTELVKSCALENNAYLVDLNSTCADVLDIGGLPFRNEHDRLQFALASFLPLMQDDEKYKDYTYIILFIDELPLAPRELQSVLYKMVQERMIRQDFLNEKVRIFSAGNLKTDLGNHNEPPAPLKNRESHVYLEPDAIGWCDWAKNNHIHPSIIAFIEGNPQYIHVLANKHGKDNYKKYVDLYAFYTPRSWHNMSDDLWYAEEQGRSDGYIRTLIFSWIGTLGNLFYTYYKNSVMLPKAKDVLDGKSIKDLNKWKKIINDSEYQQSLLLYLSYMLCFEIDTLSKVYIKKDGNDYSYASNPSFNKSVDNAFEFLDKVSDGDAALKQAFYYNFTIRYSRSHNMDSTSTMFNYLISDEMSSFNQYEFVINKANMK